MNIVCYGDSNTYGFNPLDGGRYETCWVDIVRANYKDDFVVNAGSMEDLRNLDNSYMMLLCVNMHLLDY